jgi:hypothetical protein
VEWDFLNIETQSADLVKGHDFDQHEARAT